MNEIIFMIQELNQQQSLFRNKIFHATKLLEKYCYMAKDAVQAAGLTFDFSTMEKQIAILQELLSLLEKPHELETLFEMPEEGAQQGGRRGIHISVDKVYEKVAKLEERDGKLQNLVGEVQHFDESLRFDETYEDIMGYVSKLKREFADYQMVSVMVRKKLIEMCKAYEDLEQSLAEQFEI